MAARAWGEEYRTTLVCVDSYENGVPKGRFYNPCMPAAKSFYGVTQFLQEMDAILEQMDFPKSFTARRTFSPNRKPMETDEQQQKLTGDQATFALRVLFRQNASWQGSVTWLEGRQEQSFRSVLELILLLDSAMNYQDASAD